MHEEINHLLAEPGRQAWVVYPGEQAVPISSLCPQDAASATDGVRTLILLDGTWKKAYKMWQLSSNLQQLPSVMLDNVEKGNYRIRKSPREEGVSTVEAGFLALSAMDGETDKYLPLIDTFNKMIEFQIQQMPAGVYQKNYGAS